MNISQITDTRLMLTAVAKTATLRLKISLSICIFLLLLPYSASFAQNEKAKVVELQTFWNTPGETLALEQFVKHAERKGIRFDIVRNDTYNDLRTTVAERIYLGYPPDMSHWVGGEDLSTIVDSGYLMSVPELIGDRPLNAIVYPEVMEQVEYNDLPLALPVGIHLQVIAIYNMELLAKVGISEPPSTWEEFLDMAEKLFNKGITPVALSDEFWGLREVLHGILVGIDRRQGLLDIYGKFDERGVLKANLERAFEIMFQLREYADEKHVGRGWADTVGQVIEDKAASVFMGDFARSELIVKAPDRLENFRCAAMPGKVSAYYGVDIFILFNKNDPQWRDSADKIVEVVLSPEAQADYVYYKGGLPVVFGIDPDSLNSCSQASLAIWNNEAGERFASPGPRDNERIAIIHGVLPKLWADKSLDAKQAADILYNSLSPLVSLKE